MSPLKPTTRLLLRHAKHGRDLSLRTPAMQSARNDMARILRDQRRCEYIGPSGARDNKRDLASLLAYIDLEQLEVAHA